MNRRLTTAAIPVVFIIAWTLLACGRTTPATEATAASEPDYLIVPGERIGRITADNCSRGAVLAAYGDEAQAEEIYLGEGILGSDDPILRRLRPVVTVLELRFR